MEPSNMIITYYSDKKHRSMATRDRRMPETDRPIDQPNEVCPWKYLHILNLCLPTKSWVFGSIPLKVRKWADGLLCFFLFLFRWWKLRLITKSQNDERTTKIDSVQKTSPLPFRRKGNSVQNYWVGSTFSRRSLPNTASKLTGLFPTNALVMRQSEAKGKYQTTDCNITVTVSALIFFFILPFHTSYFIPRAYDFSGLCPNG